jgi:hypothetical protein
VQRIWKESVVLYAHFKYYKYLSIYLQGLCKIAKIIYSWTNMIMKKLKKLNSVAFSPQANYTDRATAAWRS